MRKESATLCALGEKLSATLTTSVPSVEPAQPDEIDVLTHDEQRNLERLSLKAPTCDDNDNMSRSNMINCLSSGQTVGISR